MAETDAAKIILVAMTESRVIGRENTIPWHVPEDLRLFRELTRGHAVLMGRRTFESIGRPLPERRNLVLSRYLPPTADVEVCRSFAQAMQRAAGEKLFFIGGRSIYASALQVADFLRISWIAGEYPGDVFFPPFSLTDWEEVEISEFRRFRHILYRRRGKCVLR